MTIKDTKIVNKILKDGGITLDIKTNQTLTKHYGYMIAISGCELTIPVEELTKKVIDEYIEDNLTILNQDRYFLGAWVNEGLVYLDVSKFSGKLLNALWLGHFENQLAIYDLENKVSIEIEVKK